MVKNTKGSRSPSKKNAKPQVELHYQLLRNTTSPDEVETGVRSYVVNLPAFEILKLDTKENLRSYLVEYNAKKRNRVHDAIKYTIDTEPSRFITRNSGFVISASDIEVDDNKKILALDEPSIINGAQSQGEIRKWISENYGTLDAVELDEYEPPFHVRAEIVVDPDPSEVVETAIARNTATPVKSISQAGARGHLEDLQKAIQKVRPGFQLRKSETDEDVYDTRRILQYTRLLMPVSVSGNDSPAEKLRPYKNPEQCLTEFSQWFEDRDRDEAAAEKYRFMVEMAAHAINEYEYWESNPSWNGQRVWAETKKGGRACKRDATGKVAWVSPGIIFPIMGAMSEFVVKKSSGWTLEKPKLFKPEEMIARAVAQFRSANSDPMIMGRSAGAYDALRIYPGTIMEVMREMNSSR